MATWVLLLTATETNTTGEFDLAVNPPVWQCVGGVSRPPKGPGGPPLFDGRSDLGDGDFVTYAVRVLDKSGHAVGKGENLNVVACIAAKQPNNDDKIAAGHNSPYRLTGCVQVLMAANMGDGKDVAQLQPFNSAGTQMDRNAWTAGLGFDWWGFDTQGCKLFHERTQRSRFEVTVMAWVRSVDGATNYQWAYDPEFDTKKGGGTVP